MSVADDYSTNPLCQPGPLTGPPTGGAQPLSGPQPAEAPKHRVAEVRRQQGISLRSAARRMGVPLEQVRREEAPHADLSLTDLYRWQRALEVPVADLLVEHDAPLSGPVLSRARMLRVMKTVRAIDEANQDAGIGRLTGMLVTQLLEVMPELQEVSAWHSVGQRRTQDEMGRIAERPVSDSFARDGLS
ncbi:MAG: helix-turn-helix transcriptional regulator [Planctomycetota bacterium]